ncbi:MAG: porin [Deltaproteobacteria bacterium]|nr:porin [Deltaproteobacteria bacterium]
MLMTAVSLFIMQGSVLAYDITDKFSVGGVLAGNYQYLQGDEDSAGEDVDDGPKASVVFQPEMSFRPYQNSELFAKFGFAANNGLNVKSPFVLATWAADLEDDVEDINGRSRDYLLTAWANHTFEFSESHSLGLTGGIIDSTDYVDENAFANDEYGQFQNEVFVNAVTGNFVSYDVGGAAQWAYGRFGVNAMIMDVGENEQENNFQFYAAQASYRLETGLGQGNYRITGTMTSDNFLNAEGDDDDEQLTAVVFSADQQLGSIFGVFLRVGFQDDDAAITYEQEYSGGVNISGSIWGREQDNIGLGVAYLDDGETEVDNAMVAEAYVRFGLNEMFAATVDFQYMEDEYDDPGEDVDGVVGSIRITAEF